MKRSKFKFSNKTAAYNAIRVAAGHHDEAAKNRLIAQAHKQWPVKK